MKRLVIGTAGHVDHGKTALIKALTGYETDRLPEEKRRGISIELGFAPFSLPGICIVDVPGHEKFIPTMVSGAAQMNAVLLVVAANEGLRPQTLEHVEICRLLRIEHFVCVLTKTDLVARETVELRTAELKKFLSLRIPGLIPIVPVNIHDSASIDFLREEIKELISRIPRLPYNRPTTVPIDRVFSLPGVGCVITGTLSGGVLRRGDRVEILPDKIPAFARSLQIFGQDVEEAEPQTRLAIHLGGISPSLLRRGQTICRPDEIVPSRRLHVRLNWLDDIPSASSPRIRALWGTQEIAGRLLFEERNRFDFCEMRLSSPMVMRSGDQIILRTESPPRILAGAQIIDPYPTRSIRQANLTTVASLPPADRISHWLAESPRSVTIQDAGRRLGLLPADVGSLLEPLLREGPIVQTESTRFASRKSMDQLAQHVYSVILEKRNISVAEIMTSTDISSDQYSIQYVLKHLSATSQIEVFKGRARIPESVAMLPIHPAVELVKQGGLSPPTADDLAAKLGENLSAIKKILAVEADYGRLVRVSEALYFSQSAIENALGILRTIMKPAAPVTLSQWKTAVGLTRKYAVPLLEHFDRERYTICRPDRTRLIGPRLR